MKSSRLLGAIRAIEAHKFDYLVGVLFTEDYSVRRAALIPYAVVLEYGRHSAHVNALRFMLRDSVWSLPGVEEITDKLVAAQTEDFLVKHPPDHAALKLSPSPKGSGATPPEQVGQA